MIDAELYELSVEESDLLLPAETTTLFGFGSALRGFFTVPSAMAVEDWRALVEKLRRSAEALALLNRSIREDLRQAIDTFKRELICTLLQQQTHDKVKALNQPLKVIPKSLHPVDYR